MAKLKIKNFKKTICFDIDSTICKTDSKNYLMAKPNKFAIKKINELYHKGFYIKLFTSRYMGRNKENMSIYQIAKVVKKTLEFPEFKNIPIIKTESNDNRSYHINSDKIINVLGFKVSRTIKDAISELCKKFKNNQFKNSLENDIYYNIKRMKNLKAS